MKSITIEPINNGSVDEILDFSLQDSTSIEQLYQNFRMRVVEQYGDCDFQFGQVVIYQKKNPNRRLTQHMKISHVSTDRVDIVILFPRDNTPIIILQLGDKEYFISEYTKHDRLSQILNKMKGPVSAVIQQQKFDRIAINGTDINYVHEKNEQFRKFLQGHINETISIAIYAQKDENAQRQAKMVVPERQPLKEKDMSSQKVEIKLKNRQNQQNQQQYQIPIKQQKAQEVVPRPNIKVQAPKVQIPKLQSPVQSKKKLEQVIPFKKLQNPLQLVIIFQTQSGKTQKSIPANRAHSLLQMLPEIVCTLKQSGFQWQNNEYEHSRDRDKLRIIIDGNNQFKKMDRPFRQLVSQTQGQLILTFERHYEGG